MEKRVLITGAAGALGSEFARSLHKQTPELSLDVTDINESGLQAIAEEVKARRQYVCNIFENGPERAEVISSCADVSLWNAAINLDFYQPENERVSLREKQNEALQKHVEQRIFYGRSSSKHRLLIVTNSVASFFMDELEFARTGAEEKNWQYPLMKQDQSQYLRSERERLERAGVQLSVLHPGALNSTFTNSEEALKLANQFGKKMKGKKGRADWKQEKLIEPSDIAHAVAGVVRTWLATGAIPEKAKEWVILNKADLDLTPEASDSNRDPRTA